jgi:hypothetical protein
MSVDTGFLWSAKSLQAPVQAHLQSQQLAVHHAIQAHAHANMARQIHGLAPQRSNFQAMLAPGIPDPNGSTQMPTADQDNIGMDGGSIYKTPAEKAWAAAHPNKAATFQTMQPFAWGSPVPANWAANHPNKVAAAAGVNPTADIATKVMGGVFGSGGPGNDPTKIPTPGINPAITTAVPTAPTTGIPTMAASSGWLSPGANFQIR